MTGWLYLHFPQLYRHSLEQDERLPFAVIHPQSLRVLQCNRAAQQRGIATDMPLASALFLCPELLTHELDPRRQQDLLLQRALWAYQFSAQVSPDPHDGLWLEASSMLTLFGGLQAFWTQIAEQCAEQRWPVQMATGLTPLAARWLALADAGIATLEHGPLQQQLQTLGLEHLRLDPDDLSALQRLGLSRLGQLLQLPLADVGRRLSVTLMQQLRQLRGDISLPMQTFQPALTFHADALFVSEVEHRNGLLFPLTRLLTSLSGFLHHHQLSTRWLELQLIHREPPDSYWEFGLARAEYRQQELLQVCRYQLERRQLRAPVLEMHLRVSRFQPRAHQQQNCLSEQPPDADRDASLLNRLQSRLTDSQLQRLSSTGDPRPECAWRPLALEQESATGTPRRSNERPLWLLQTPRPCTAPVRILCGPERIDAGWWDEQPVRRDYYQIMVHEQRLWVFRDDQGQWFVQGYFA